MKTSTDLLNWTRLAWLVASLGANSTCYRTLVADVSARKLYRVEHMR